MAWLGVLLGAIGTIVSILVYVHTEDEARVRHERERQELLYDALNHLSGGPGVRTFTGDPARIELARQKIELARSLDDESPEVHLCEGLYHEARGSLSAAEEAYRRALDLSEERFGAAYASLGFVLAQQGRVEEAGQVLEEAAGRGVESAAVHTNLCLVFHLQERLEEAAGACRQALQVDDRYLPAHNNLGNVLMAQGRLQAAIDRLQEALEIDPNAAGIRTNLGLALKYEGQDNRALTELQRAFELDPTSGMVRLELAALYRARGDDGDDLRAEILESSAELVVEGRPVT